MPNNFQRRTDRSSSRREILRELMQDLLDGDDSPSGVDARTRGSDRSAVDASAVEIDDDAAQRAGESGSSFGQGMQVSDGSAPRTRAETAKQALKQRARKQREALQERASNANTKQAIKRALAAQDSDINVDEFVDRRKKSRNQEVAERATDAARIRAPMGGSLRTVGDERVVTDMARSGAAMGAGLLSGPPADFGGGSPDSNAALLTWGSDGDRDGDSDQDESDPLEFDDPFGLSSSDGDDEVFL